MMRKGRTIMAKNKWEKKFEEEVDKLLAERQSEGYMDSGTRKNPKGDIDLLKEKDNHGKE
jgi:hypothetical protein